MRTKKIDKKLSLNKKTIAVLNNGELSVAKGGGTDFLTYRLKDCRTVNYCNTVDSCIWCLMKCPSDNDYPCVDL